MKALALLGSPRNNGNSEIIATEILRGARNAGAETRAIRLDDVNIKPIGGVIDNSRKQEDTRNDDDLPGVLEHFLQADVVVMASPLYWHGVSAQLKCCIDRLSCYFRRPPYAERFDGKGYIVVATYGRPEPEHAEWITRPMKATVETLRGRYLGEVCALVYQKGRVREMAEVMETAYVLGRDAVVAASDGARR